MAGLGWARAPGVSLRPRVRPGRFAERPSAEAEALIREARLDGQVSYALVDVGSGRRLESRGAAVGLPPASVTKVVTALYALDTLGPGYRFQTRLLASGPVRDGVLEGDLILAGGGDPTLDTDALADVAARLKGTGLRAVRDPAGACGVQPVRLGAQPQLQPRALRVEAGGRRLCRDPRRALGQVPPGGAHRPHVRGPAHDAGLHL